MTYSTGHLHEQFAIRYAGLAAGQRPEDFSRAESGPFGVAICLAGPSNGPSKSHIPGTAKRFSKLVHFGVPKTQMVDDGRELTTDEQVKAIPAVTRKGFEWARWPEDTWQALRADFHSNRDNFFEEEINLFFSNTSDLHPCLLYPHEERNLKRLLKQVLQGISARIRSSSVSTRTQ